MKWNIINTGIASAKRNMELDAKLLEELSGVHPILHLYDWKQPCVTYGHFIDPESLLSKEAYSSLELAKRPTGGGMIFHLTDWAFSVLVPASHESYSTNTLENYAFVNHLVIKAIHCFLGRQTTLSLLPQDHKASDYHFKNFCMAKPTIYDVMLEGKKVAGGAQRRTRAGYLHQGSISLAFPEHTFLQNMLIPETCVYQSMLENTSVLLNEYDSKDLSKARRHLQECFVSVIKGL